MRDVSLARRLAVAAGLFIAVLVACGREIIGPATVPASPFQRTAAFAFEPKYETAIPASALRAALTQVAFERVRITLRREDGSIAFDTVVVFPAGADELTLTLSVPLPASAPASGVPLNLHLGYVNAAGDTVFRGGPVRVMVVPAVSGGTTPSPTTPVQIPVQYTGTGASAATVAIAPKSFSGLAGQSTTFTAQAFSAGGQAIPGTPVVFTSSNTAVVTVDQTSGAATLIGRGTAKVYALLLTGPSDSATVAVTLPAARLEAGTGGNQTGPAGSTLPTPVVARVLASDGVGVGGTTVTFAASGGGTVTPASAVSDATGTVNTQWKLGTTAGAQTLTITSAGLTGSPITVSANALPVIPTKLTILTGPVSGRAAAALPAITVAAQDAGGNTVTTFTGDVTVAIGSNPGSATLSGTATAKAVAGIATFSDLKLNRPGTAYTFVFSSASLAAASSAPFNITAGDATQLVFGAMPSAVDAGITIAPPVTVSAQDAAGNAVASFTGPVTIAIGSNPGGSVRGGTATRNAVAGVATFSDLTLNRSGTPYTFTASAPGLTDATSAAFTVSPGPPSALIVVSGGGQSAAAGTALSPVTVRLQDALGNGIGGLSIAFAVTGGGGSLSGSTAITDADGKASVIWTIGAGPQTMTATYAGASPVTVTATATPGQAKKLAITSAPGTTQTAGVAITPTVVVQGQDSLGVLQIAFAGTVTASVASGPSGATIGGTASVTAMAGVASFSALRLTKAGTYTLTFASSGVTSATTASFTVIAAPAKNIAVDSGNAQSGAAGTALPAKLVVVVTDSVGNRIPGAPLTWNVTAGGGSLAGASATTDTSGRGRATWTLGSTAGTNAVQVTSSGLTGSPVTFTATATSASLLVFVSNSNSDNISHFNGQYANSVNCTTIGGSCSEPRNPAVSFNGMLVAVPFRFGNRVAFFDPVTSNFVSAVTDTSFHEPYAVAFSGDGSELWVSNKNSSTVSIVNVASGLVVAVVRPPLLNSPEGIAIAAGKAFVASRGNGRVIIVDVATRVVLNSVVVGGNPRDAVGTPDGQWVYVTKDAGSVAKVKVSDGTVTQLTITGSSRNITISPDGLKVYVATQNSAVAVIVVASDAVSQITFTGASNTYGVAILKDGSMGFATDSNLGKVFAFNPATGVEVTGSPFPFSVGSGPRGVVAY